MIAVMMYRRTERGRKRRKTALFLIVALIVAVLVGAGVWYVFVKSDPPKKAVPLASHTQQPPTKEIKKEAPKPPLVDLQPTVDAWLAKYKYIDFGIVVYDPANDKIIAAHNPDEKFFAASLYKLYIAYLALEDFQSGKQDPSEILTQGYTRKQCVDKMIRESYSPCGEAMMAAMGQESLRQRVAAMGINNTVFAGITTTAQDASLILKDIVAGHDLSAENTDFLKNAMRIQPAKFRGGLAKGSPKATWETKVGWNEQYNYHDVGIMTLPSGRQYVVAILSYHNGSPTPIASFSATIYNALR